MICNETMSFEGRQTKLKMSKVVDTHVKIPE